MTAPPVVAPLPRDIAEKDFARTFEETAHIYGWRGAHFRSSLNARGHHMTAVGMDGAGWPDYLLTKRATGDRIAVELKTRYNKPTPEQERWLEDLALCGIESYCWWPPDWPEIVARLAFGR